MELLRGRLEKVPSNALQMPPLRMPPTGFVVRNSHDTVPMPRTTMSPRKNAAIPMTLAGHVPAVKLTIPLPDGGTVALGPTR